MFRAAFHTGYPPPRVLWLTKAQLDGLCEDRRFDDGFFVNLRLLHQMTRGAEGV